MIGLRTQSRLARRQHIEGRRIVGSRMDAQSDNPDREEYQETRELVVSAFGLARSLSIQTLVVQADEITDVRLTVENSRIQPLGCGNLSGSLSAMGRQEPGDLRRVGEAMLSL